MGQESAADMRGKNCTIKRVAVMRRATLTKPKTAVIIKKTPMTTTPLRMDNVVTTEPDLATAATMTVISPVNCQCGVTHQPSAKCLARHVWRTRKPVFMRCRYVEGIRDGMT